VRAGVGAVVGVAGTFTTLVAHQIGLRVYDPALVHGRLLTLAQIDVAIRLFRVLTSAERGRLAGIKKGREDVILAGALIAQAACRAFGVEAALVSESDILDGIALWLADGCPSLA
jgi:exopolyphosphatase/guanosine-5'-triphosphate,3'-diphosphate pyrophosphatase